jgi:hypothetical protein
MQRHFLFLGAAAAAFLCLLLATGCESEMESAAGTYAMDKEGVKESVKAKGESDGASSQEIDMALAMIDGMTMQLTLNADGTASTSTSMMGQSQSTSGTWTISGGDVTVSMKDEDGQSQSITGKLEGESLEMDPPPGSDMPFKLVFRKQST